MRPLVPFALVATLFLFVAAFVPGQAESANDLTGTWNVSVQAGQEGLASTMQLVHQGDSLTGTIRSDVGNANIRGQVRGDTVSFGFSMAVQGQSVSISASAVLTDPHNMRGTLNASGQGAFPFTARRPTE